MRFGKWANVVRHWIWVAPLAIGVVFVVAGVYMMTEGQSAKNEVRDAIVAENIITAEDASIPNVLVNSADTAKAEADVIEMHYLESTGGLTYAELDRDDPARETAFRAANLRTSLNLAVMGFKVSDLVIGMGAFMLVIGATFVVFMAPAIYYSAEVANHYNELIKKEERERPLGGTAPQVT